MKLPVNYHYLTTFDTNEIKLDNGNWNEYTWRQNKFKVHIFTETIPLMWSTWKPDEPLTIYTFKNDYPVQPIYDYLLNVYPNCTIVKSAFIKLLSNANIIPHIDSSIDLQLPHRVHICIIPGDNTVFIVNDEQKIFKQGECFEINNLVVHSVENKGSKDRIHLLIDLLQNEYIKEILYKVANKDNSFN